MHSDLLLVTKDQLQQGRHKERNWKRKQRKQTISANRRRKKSKMVYSFWHSLMLEWCLSTFLQKSFLGLLLSDDCPKKDFWTMTWSTTAVQIWISYIFHIISLHGKIWTKKNDLVPNVWLHCSVGRASHQCHRGHGFESRWSPNIFRLLPSHCLNWKIYCDDHSSLSSTTAVQIWISYIFHNDLIIALQEVWK